MNKIKKKNKIKLCVQLKKQKLECMYFNYV